VNHDSDEEKKVSVNDRLFQLLNQLNWKDRDEEIMQQSRIKRVNIAELKSYTLVIDEFASNLSNVLKAHSPNIFRDMSDTQITDFLWHIVAKGKVFYDACMSDPEFCLYLIDQYQPLNTMIKALI
jgi:hypothetical protein